MKLFTIIFYFLFVQVLMLSVPTHAEESIFDTSALSFFNQQDEFLPVEKAFSIDFYQQNDELEINIHIEPGYYLYRKQFKFTPNNATYDPIFLPEGESHEDEYFGVQQIYKEDFSFTIKLLSVQDNASIKLRYQGCAEKGLCYPPTSMTLPINTFVQIEKTSIHDNSSDIAAAIKTQNSQAALTSLPAADKQVTASGEQHQLADMLQNRHLGLTLLAFFVGGLLLSFTPCVFPMYPILTGIIVGQGDKLTTARAFRLSFVYVQGMAITYTLLGIVVALAGAQFQAMFQHPVVLALLSILFIFLALSMFGVFNLALPQSWQNKLNQISNKQKGGSYIGVLLMGALSGLVASPCTTAPLTGALLYISQSGDIILGALALYALSLGMGLPLLLIGSSGGKLLPKAGNWMTVIKNIFGLLLLAVPIFLLERFVNADVSSLLWSALILAAGGYFYAVNQSNQSMKIGYIFRSIVIFIILFIGANKAYETIFPNAAIETSTSQQEHHFKRVRNLTELNHEIALSQAQDQKIMLDLYADWCIACKEFEKYTFSDNEVKNALREFKLLQIDLTDTGSQDSIELMDNFQVFGLPSILFFNENGIELTGKRVTGFMDATSFTHHIINIDK